MMEAHGQLLEKHMKVYYASAKKNKLLRLIDMIVTFILKARTVDVVIIAVYSTLNFYYAYILAMLCRIYRKPYIAYLHGGNLPTRLHKSPRLSRSIFAHSYANVATSGYLKAAFIGAGYNATIIPNFIEVDAYCYENVKNWEPKFIWVRAFEKTYHPEMAIYVLNELMKTYPNAQLCMVGPDKDGTKASCLELATQLGLQGNVALTGSLSKSEWINISVNYNFFINTTHFDNTPVSIIEAMALGLPIISTNVGGMPFLIEHGQEGLLSDDSDVPAMVKNIKRLLESPNLAETLSRNARKKAESFDWKLVEKQWIQLFSAIPQ